MRRATVLAALLLTLVLSLFAPGECRASAPAGSGTGQHQGQVRREVQFPRDVQAVRDATVLRSVAETRRAAIEDDDDDLGCKPEAVASGHRAALPAPDTLGVLARSGHRACRTALLRAAGFRARQRLDDAYPTGPPSIAG